MRLLQVANARASAELAVKLANNKRDDLFARMAVT